VGDFLGTGTIANQNRQYRSFEESRKFARKLGLEGKDDWFEYCKSGKKPFDIPYTPSRTYKEFKTWGDWLGTGRISSVELSKNMLTYEEAEKQAPILVKKLGIETHADWLRAYNEGRIPKNLPSQPWEYYSERKQSKRKK